MLSCVKNNTLNYILTNINVYGIFLRILVLGFGRAVHSVTTNSPVNALMVFIPGEHLQGSFVDF